MNRKIINLGQYKYLCEHYINGIDFEDNTTRKFVVLRNYDIYNNIVYDKDFLFIENNVFNMIKQGIHNIAYPTHIDNVLSFTDSFKYFNQYNLTNIDDIKYDIYDSEGNIANIKYDIIRIYMPTIKKNIDFIIDIDNIINDIDFHYFCNLFSHLVKKCNKEIVIDNTRFIEYVDLVIPNINYLFKKENKLYINDDISNITNIVEHNSEIETNKKWVNGKWLDSDSNDTVDINIKNISDYYKIKNLELATDNTLIDENEDNKLYINNLINTFFIRKDNENIYKKVYINNLNNDNISFNNNVINTSINITLYPYKGIDNNIYIISDYLLATESFIGTGNYFRLSAKMGFDNGTISLLNTFEFPGKLEEKTEYDSIEEAAEMSDILSRQVSQYYNSFFINENIENYEHELDEESFTGIRSTGFNIQIATDSNFLDIVYESNINTDENDENFIYDFSFSLNHIIDNWLQLNEILIMRSIFIDKRLNIIIYSNPVVLTKEWFKYLINDTSDQILYFSKNTNSLQNKNWKEFMDVNQGFNFIENINCSIIEKTEEERNEEKEFLKKLRYGNQTGKTKIIYKPIFYKVNDLQSIELRDGVVQNIGINLSQYMTKVNTFNINFNGYNVKESLRNDIYVIFSINANLIDKNSGYYNILDEDYNYISSGDFIKY